MKILFSTHGETLQNLEDILQGQQQGELSPKGVEQIKYLAEALRDERIDYIFTSPLKRCTDTAQQVKKYHSEAKYIEDPRLKARALGILEGKKRDEEEWENLEGDHYTKKPLGGETLTDTWERIKLFYDEIIHLPSKTTIYMCAHGETKLILEGLLYNYAIEKTFRGHDGKGILPTIWEPAKTEIVIYEFQNCTQLPDMFIF